ncbi:hypothetical protein JHK87_031492 [Glycine soja]|nr:hypothetical protein JHK87_031492 [Glycine soja]
MESLDRVRGRVLVPWAKKGVEGRTREEDMAQNEGVVRRKKGMKMVNQSLHKWDVDFVKRRSLQDEDVGVIRI